MMQITRVWRVGLACSATVAVMLALAVVAVSDAYTARPMLILSRTSGSAGTRVDVLGRHCPKPQGAGDTLAWHDHYGWTHDAEKRPPLGLWRRVPVTRTSATSVHAVFVVLRSDHPGLGLLDLFCGGGKGNATATFTVTR